jgi:hypothetical protein
VLPQNVRCPNCGEELELTDEERVAEKFKCEVCNTFVTTFGGAPSERKDQWKCPSCGERVGSTLDACWNCGTTREGEELPSTERQRFNSRREVDNAEKGTETRSRVASAQTSRSEGKMDMHKFGGFILLIGTCVFLYGLIVIVTNLDEKFDPSESKVDRFFGRMDLQNALNVNAENYMRAQRRSDAVSYLIAGGVVCLVGYGMRASSKRNTQLTDAFDSRSEEPDNPYCSNCSKTVPDDADICPHCGIKL